MRSVLAIMLLLTVAEGARAQDLCPQTDAIAVTEGTRLSESTFEVQLALDAADKLFDYLNKTSISYDFDQALNALVIKGALLRQQAMLATMALELARLKPADGATDKSAVDLAEIEVNRTLRDFCQFMAGAVVAK